MASEESRMIMVEAPSGERFEATIPCGTLLSQVAADFFEARGWPTQDSQGRGQRAVVELVNPTNPEETKRLNSELDICESGTEDGDILRVFPESIAGAVDHQARLTALISDHNDMVRLSDRTAKMSFTPNRSHAPDRYEITFGYPSFIELPAGQAIPLTGECHRVKIELGADYPRRAPITQWLTPIFHPNIDQPNGAVCLGVLQERYLPGLGLARLVLQLAEMVQWRNFDAYHGFNEEAARWAADTQNWEHIHAIGGHPFQGPIAKLLKNFQEQGRTPITFRRATSAAQTG